MQNEIQVFNFQGNSVRTMVDSENEVWFVGRDVAESLGYSKSRNAIAAHVDDDDKKDAPIQGPLGGKQQMTLINESGVYSLVFGSKLPEAKKFKRWVTSEVLPSIRKTGGYKMPMTPEEMIDLLLQNSSKANKRIDKVEEQSKKNEERITNLEDNRFLNPNEYGYLNTQVSARIKQVKETHKWQLNREQNNQLYRAIGREIKQITGVRCRSQIRFKDFDKVCEFVNTWEPSHATLYNIGMVKGE